MELQKRFWITDEFDLRNGEREAERRQQVNERGGGERC
jgi:hypothetical protein